MNDSDEELARTWLTERAQRLSQLSTNHPLAIDLAICLTVAALSIGGLATQHRLDPLALIFCGALCAPLLLRRISPIFCFAVIAFVALAQWLLAGPQLADAALLVALYWVALDGSLLEGAIAAGTLELGAIMAALRWSPSEPLKVWVGLTGLTTAAAVLGVSIRQRRALLVSLHEKAARLEFERDQEGRLGAAAERARIAREMHDIVAHNLTRDDRAGRRRHLRDGLLSRARDPGDPAGLRHWPPGADRDAPPARRAARGVSGASAGAPAKPRPAR